jgi:diphthamide biosynthesis protein 4
MTNHFTVLGLEPSSNLTQSTLKNAYHRALLQFHPDKSKAKVASPEPGTTVARTTTSPSIDDITRAYKTLADPRERTRHILEINQQASNGLATPGTPNVKPFTALDVDLDDLTYDETAQAWTRDCRCGKRFTLKESDLEKETAELDGDGEIFVGCPGCSLWLRVLFWVAEEDG